MSEALEAQTGNGWGQGWLTKALALSSTTLAAGIFLVPKDGAPAADSRLALAIAFLAASATAAVSALRAYWSWRERRAVARYSAAGSTVRDTLSYLRNERHLARRGYVPLLVGSSAGFSGYLLSYWPQIAMLAPWREMLGSGALVGVAALPIMYLRNRRHRTNSRYLRRLLREQLQHIGYRARRRRWRIWPRKRSSRPVTPVGKDSFRIDDFTFTFADLKTNVLVLGQIGSGKTICVLNNFLEGLISTHRHQGSEISGLVLDAKGDFNDKMARLCQMYGREDDLYVIDPARWPSHGGTRQSIAWNPLDNTDDALEVATRLMTVMRLLGLEIGSEGSFWIDSAKTFLRHSITLVREAQLRDAPSIIDVYRLAQESEEATPLYHSLIAAIALRYPADVPVTVKDAFAFFESEWAEMGPNQKSGVKGSVTQLIDEFLVPPFHEIFTQKSTISISEIIDGGKLLYVAMPASDRERMSRIVNTMVKLEFQRQILLRPRKARPSFMLADEFQTFFTSGLGRGDSDFFERSRESNHTSIVASQNLEAFKKRVKNVSDVTNFFGHCGMTIMLRNTEAGTRRYASELFGQRSDIVVTINEQAPDSSFSRKRHTSYGRSTRIVPRVPPEAFLHLNIPVQADPSHHYAQSIIHLGSRETIEHVHLNWPVNPLR